MFTGFSPRTSYSVSARYAIFFWPIRRQKGRAHLRFSIFEYLFLLTATNGSQSVSSALVNVIYNPLVMLSSCVSLIYVVPAAEINHDHIQKTFLCAANDWEKHTWPLNSVNCFPSMPRAPFSEDGYQRNHAHSRPQKSKHVDRSLNPTCEVRAKKTHVHTCWERC